MTHDEINKLIATRDLFSGNEENTYFTQEGYGFVCDNYDDPAVLFKHRVYFYYAKKYKWTNEQAVWFIENNLADSTGWSDGRQMYYYDWGTGKNKVTDHPMHVPNLDHIDPVSLSQNNSPENFRIRCKRLNENKGNTNDDNERRATIIDLFLDMDPKNRKELIKYLSTVK